MPPEQAGDQSVGLDDAARSRSGSDVVRRLRPGEQTLQSVNFNAAESDVDENARAPIACGPVPAQSMPPRATEPHEVAGAVLALVAEVLGGDRTVSTDDDLFEMEFDSLMMARLAARVYGRLGAELPLRAYFEAESVGDLIAIVQAAVPA
jgi:acyl carrier protein